MILIVVVKPTDNSMIESQSKSNLTKIISKIFLKSGTILVNYCPRSLSSTFFIVVHEQRWPWDFGYLKVERMPNDTHYSLLISKPKNHLGNFDFGWLITQKVATK